MSIQSRIALYYQKHGLEKTLKKYQTSFSNIAGCCNKSGIPIHKGDYTKAKRLEEAWLNDVPSTIEEARRLNWKPNKKRLRAYWAMIKDYNRHITKKTGGGLEVQRRVW